MTKNLQYWLFRKSNSLNLKLYIMLAFAVLLYSACAREVLKNGKYEIVYDEEFSSYPNVKFIKNNGIFTYLDKDSSEFEIQWISKSEFRLNQMIYNKDSISNLEKQMNSMGIPYFELLNKKKDTLRFVQRHNLHVVISSGKIIYIE